MKEINIISQWYQTDDAKEIKAQLINCVQISKDEFYDFRKKEIKAWNKEIDIFTCLKLYILAKKTIDFKSEMKSQIKEIEKEVSKQKALDNNRDIKEIKASWTKNKAATWRAHRILEIVYVLNQNKNEFINLLVDN